MNIRMVKPGEKGYDSAGHPLASEAIKRGYTFRAFYLGHSSKADTVKQIQEELAAGIDLIAIAEGTGTEPLKGLVAGDEFATKYCDYAQEVGYPPGGVIICTLDTDYLGGNIHVVPFFSSCQSVILRRGYRFGGYWDLETQQELAKALIIPDVMVSPGDAWGWHLPKDPHILQLKKDKISGITVDIDTCLRPFPVWTNKSVWTPPKQAPYGKEEEVILVRFAPYKNVFTFNGQYAHPSEEMVEYYTSQNTPFLDGIPEHAQALESALFQSGISHEDLILVD